MATFVDHPLRLLNPSFSSPLLDVLTDLEHLRRLEIRATTHPTVFVQLKQVFHLLESLASARIEGNHTTLADYVETKFAAPSGAGRPGPEADSLREIANIELAMDEIESAVAPGFPITEHLLRGLHAMTVDGLQREGDKTPGAYRTAGHLHGEQEILRAARQRTVDRQQVRREIGALCLDLNGLLPVSRRSP